MSRAQLTSTVEQNTGGAVAPYVAGKNKVINGDFGIWQRGTSFPASSTGYTTDRWWNANGSAGTIERSTDVPSGFAYSLFLNGATGVSIGTALELPATGAPLFTPGTSVTLSFWAKATTSTTITPILYYRNDKFNNTNQSNFTGSGTAINITSSWARYSYTYTASTPNSTNTVLSLELSPPSTLRITGVQLEAGSVATPFTTATGTFSGELQACQRYCWVMGINVDWPGQYYSTSTVYGSVKFPSTMRAVPSLTVSTAGAINVFAGGSGRTSTAITSDALSTDTGGFGITTPANGTAGWGTSNRINSGATATWSAEL